MGSALSKFRVFTRKLRGQPKVAPLNSASTPTTQIETTLESVMGARSGTETSDPVELQLMVMPSSLPETIPAAVIPQTVAPATPTIDPVVEVLTQGLFPPSGSYGDTPQPVTALSDERGMEPLTTLHSDAATGLVLQPGEDPETPNDNPCSLWSQALRRLQEKHRDSLECSDNSNIKLVDKLIEAIKAKKEECDADRFSYVDSRGEKVFYAETFLTQLNKYAMIGDIAIQHNPDVVALAWAGFRLLLKVGTAYTENMAMISRSLEYLVSVMCCGEIYERLYCKMQLKAVEQLTSCLVDLYVSILEYLLCARQYLQRNTMVRIVESFSSELVRILKDIQNGERATRERADIAEKEAASTARSDQDVRLKELRGYLTEIQEQMKGIEETVIDCHKRIQDLCDFVDNKRRLDALDWVSKIEYGSHHSEYSARRILGTGDWLQDNQKFQRWESGTSGPILWLRGDAGSGKTMLASKVIDLLKNDKTPTGHVIAYFYCYYQERERYMPASRLRAIVKQLCVAFSEDGLPKCLTEIYNKRQKEGNSAGSLKIDESKKLIIDLSKRFVRTTIVIDALDECDVETRGDLFRSLTDISKDGHCIQVFVTGRCEGDIRDGFLGSLDHYINAQDNSKDINIYINRELDRLCEERPLLAPKLKQDKEKIIEKLESGAEGMFMWVHLRMQAIRRETTFRGVHQALDEFPADLDKTYSNILMRITKQSTTDSCEAQRVLRWLAYSHGLCSPETVSQALSVACGVMAPDSDRLMERSQIIDICRNLVIYDEKLQALRFAHYTVKEFLKTLAEYNEKQGNTWIAEICLRVLNNSYYWGLQTSNSVSQLLTYTIHNWAGHLKQSDHEDTDLRNLWGNFLTPSSDFYKRWASAIGSSSEHVTLKDDGQEPIHPLWVACYFQLNGIFKHLLHDGAAPNCYNHARQTPLHYAAEQGYERFTELLIGNPGIEINSKDKNNFTPLILAASNGKTVVVRLLLKDSQVDVNCKQHYGKTALVYAAWGGHEEIVELLLGRTDTLLNEQDDDGDTALLSAALRGHDGVVKLLLSNDGVEVNHKNKNGDTALSVATIHGHDKTVQGLLGKNDLEINCINNYGETPLLLAAGRGHGVVVDLLLATDDVDLGYTNNDHTPLSLAVCGGHERVVQSLLNRGVDPNYGENNYTPLRLAMDNDYPNIVKLFLDKPEVDVNFQISGGFTALSCAAWNGYDHIIELLLERDDVDLNRRDSDGDTPLALAVWKGHEKSVRVLLAKEGVDINLQNNNGVTPLLSAVQRGQERSAQMLLDKEGVDVNLPDKYGNTPLLVAAYDYQERLVQMLLDKEGVDVNCMDSTRSTPLRYAVRHGRENIVKLLLSDDRVKVICPTRHGTTPLLSAAEDGYVEMFKLLLAGYGGERIKDIDGDGDTLLLAAAAGREAEIVQLVLDRGEEDINCINKKGYTPLTMAVHHNREEVMRLLLKQPGIDVGIRDVEGETAIDTARRLGHENLVELLSTCV